ncbi:hypothetical protein AM1_C0072 (plasmid) [Acaryochloris marina MBIC11017]|uniref:Uncharacterized protein n=1 Tax=Acaryochloris marina (strain MBIC 11017) TaxID=329726 RepID=A8ZMH1_ACAM1|nr:hypothetical protein AM1_C0072 [Acaryochloris marina MBIC11017]
MHFNAPVSSLLVAFDAHPLNRFAIWMEISDSSTLVSGQKVWVNQTNRE